MSDEQRIAVIRVNGNDGYSPAQATNGLTLGELLEILEDAVAEFGEDTLVVTVNPNHRYGANFGNISIWEPVTLEGDDDGDES